MREIKYRGQDKVNKNWLYGNLEIPLINQNKSRHYILGYSYGQYQKHEVDSNTVGQYTGLKDKNGKELYEGDIYKRYDNIFVVVFDVLGFKCKKVYDSWLNKNVYNRNEISLLSKIDSDYCYEIIGNIYENPELVK